MTKHTWQLDSSGEIDDFAVEDDYHNGPYCTTCWESYCMRCYRDRWDNRFIEECSEE